MESGEKSKRLQRRSGTGDREGVTGGGVYGRRSEEDRYSAAANLKDRASPGCG